MNTLYFFIPASKFFFLYCFLIFFFFWQQLFTISRIIAWHWHRNSTTCSYRALEEKQCLPPLVGTHVLGLCFFWRSLWSTAGLRGLSPGETSCQYCRKPFLLLLKTEKALAALDRSLPPGNSRPRGFPLESCLEVLHGNEE